MAISISELLTPGTAESELALLLAIATSIGIDTTGWVEGDPELAILSTVAERFAKAEIGVMSPIEGGFLDEAEGDWLTMLAEQCYGVTRAVDQYATGVVTLTNASAGAYVIAAGDVRMANGATGATYRNTTGGMLAAGGTLDVDILAEVAGSGSSSLAAAINTMVTTLIGVTCSNAAAVTGIDAETDAQLRAICRWSLALTSPAGAADAYRYAAVRTKADGSGLLLPGEDMVALAGVTRAGVTGSTGIVTVKLADADGAPTGGDVTLVNAVIQEWIVPLGITANVSAAAAVVVPVTYTAYVPADCPVDDATIEAEIEDALTTLFANYPVGGRTVNGADYYLFADHVQSTIGKADSNVYTVALTLPAADTALTSAQVASLGVITPLVTRV